MIMSSRAHSKSESKVLCGARQGTKKYTYSARYFYITGSQENFKQNYKNFERDLHRIKECRMHQVGRAVLNWPNSNHIGSTA